MKDKRAINLVKRDTDGISTQIEIFMLIARHKHEHHRVHFPIAMSALILEISNSFDQTKKNLHEHAAHNFERPTRYLIRMSLV